MKKIIKTVFFVTAISVFTRLLGFFFRIYLSRTIGAESLGLYQISMSIVALLATFTAGLPLTLSRKTSECIASRDIKSSSSLVSSTLTIGLIVCTILFVTAHLLEPYIGNIFSDQQCKPIFYILLPTIFTTCIISTIRSWFWGQKKFLVFSLTEMVEEISRIVLGVLIINQIIFSFEQVDGTAISFVVSDVLCTIMMIIVFFSLGGVLSKPNDIKPIISASTPITGVRLYSSLVQSLIATILPSMLISIGLSSSEALSDYGRLMGMAIPILYAPAALTGSIAVVLVPEAASDRISGNINGLKDKVERSINVSILFACLFYIIFVPFGEQIGEILYSDSVAGRYISYSAILMLPLNINQITTSLLNSIAEEKKTLLHYAIGSIFLIASILILPKYVGVMSLTIGMTLCFSVTSILNLLTLRKKINISFGFVFTILFFFIGGGLSIYLGQFMMNILISVVPTMIALIGGGVMALTMFLLSSYLMGYYDIIK